MPYVRLRVIHSQCYYGCSHDYVRLSSAFQHKTHSFLLQDHNVLLLLQNYQCVDHMWN